ncbi:MAG: magnesium transporter, partial [Acidimicrobiia bacterium]|nr:magnesium transporter [Acidimicrobiia bacterium]
MAGDLIYAFRVMRLPLLDAGGATIGRIQDIVAVPGRPGAFPRVVGFVAESQRRRIFVNANRVTSLANDGARLRSWDVDLHPFKPNPGEVLIGTDILDRKIDGQTVSDVGLRVVDHDGAKFWEIAKVRLATRNNLLRRRPGYRLIDVDEVPGLFSPASEVAAEAARLRDLHPAEVANIVRSLPLSRRRLIAAAMDDERLADVLEELPEAEQLHLIEGLDLDRLIDVLDEMEYDDLADLLGEMPGDQRTRILDAMDVEGADVVRRLLSYEEATAGGMMTPELIFLGPTATVAEALAQIRHPHWVVSIAAQVFVCQPPFKAPTGKFLGTAHVQRLLREPPSME